MSFSIIPITINIFYHAKFLAAENGKIPLIGGIISSSIMMLGIVFLGTIFGVYGIAITHVLTYSILCLYSFIMARKLKN